VLIATSALTASPSLAQETGETGDTGVFLPGDTDTDTDVDSDTDVDTDTDTDVEPVFCSNCSTAAERAGEEGGGPCATGGTGPVGLLWLPLAWLARRRV
jgi:hypothetical protein